MCPHVWLHGSKLLLLFQSFLLLVLAVEVEDEKWVASAVLDSSKLTDSEDYKCRLIQRLMYVTHNPQAQPTGPAQKSVPAGPQQPSSVVASYQHQLEAVQQTIQHLQQQLQQAKAQADEASKTATPPTTHASSGDSGEVTREEPGQQKTAALVPHRPAPRVPRAPVTSPQSSLALVQSQLTSATPHAFRAKRLALEATRNAVEPFIVRNGDLKMTGPDLVKGTFGSVVVAQYKEYVMAAKS